MVGLVAFDFVLGLVLAGVVDVSFVIHVLCMHLDDSPADPSGLRVPAYMVMQLESFFHTSSFDDFGRSTSYSPTENSPGCRRSIEVFRRLRFRQERPEQDGTRGGCHGHRQKTRENPQLLHVEPHRTRNERRHPSL